jgi:cardiolipin synthase A/B
MRDKPSAHPSDLWRLRPGVRVLSRDTGLLDHAFTRAAGAPLVPGNSVRLLKDAADNYPAWLQAIRSAQNYICFENYIFREDETGVLFAEALASKARTGVPVRLIYDWMGGLGKTSRKFWRALAAAGVTVRCFNPPHPTSPFSWLQRDHRKMLAVDGRIGFVTGLCVGSMWVGDPARGIDPWRDTGIEVQGPAVHDIERAFAQVWMATGEPLSALRAREDFSSAGDVSLRIVANTPGTSGLFRIDQLIAAAARRTLWLTDAYFAGIPPYVQALRAAAMDGVDVRLLLPGASDIPILRPLSQAGYRPLLETGVKVFEWNGPMLHAKTAVADGCWARVGSSNLNLASWVGNYELDAVLEDDTFAAAMERMYLADLDNATELVLNRKRRSITATRNPQPGSGPGVNPRHATTGLSGPGGSASRATAGALRLGRTVGAALTAQRVLEPNEARIVAVVGFILLLVAVTAMLWPLVIALPLAALLAWMAVALLVRAHALRRDRRSRALPITLVQRKD